MKESPFAPNAESLPYWLETVLGPAIATADDATLNAWESHWPEEVHAEKVRRNKKES